MNYFFVNRNQIVENEVQILGQDVNHIKNVLRMKVGDIIGIKDGTKKVYHCELLVVENHGIQGKIVDVIEQNTELPSKIYLFQGLPKSDKMELIIQKAVELGVYEIIPVATKRAVVKLDEKKQISKLKRWQAVAEGGAKQSGRQCVPAVLPVKSWKEALAYADTLDVKLIPYEQAKGMGETKALIQSIKKNQSIGIFIGPEGGFEPEEIEQAKSIGIVPISLGNRILRTETAGLTILSVLMFHLEGEG